MARRILHVIATLDRAGAEKQLVLLAGGLPRSDFDVHVCALTRGGPLAAELDRDEIPLSIIGKSRKLDVQAFGRLRRHIKRLKPELVHTWMFTANAYGRAAAISAGMRNIVASERCVDCWKRWPHFAIDRQLAKRTATIIVNSRGVQEFYVRHGLPAEKFRLIYNGIEPAPACTTTRESLLAELGLPSGARLIGAVGRLWPQKRIEDLIGALRELPADRDDVYLLVIGDGPQRKVLEQYRESYNVQSRVRFLGARHDVPRLMPHFDLLWLASGYEGLPNVVMEAMAAAVPVVASDICGNRELVIDGQTGFLVPLGDGAAFATRANQILNDSMLALQLGTAGKERIEAEFTVSAMVEKHAALYREVLDR